MTTRMEPFLCCILRLEGKRQTKMLGIFNEKLVNAPKELKSPACLNSCSKGKERDEMMKDLMRFGNWWNGLWMRFGNGDGVLGYAPSMDGDHNHNQRLFSVLDDIYCVFLGELHNLSMLNKQYGLSKGGNEAMFIIQAYRTLRDRAPYPAHQVLKELEGSFGFLIYDNRDRTLFLASASNAHIPLYWGIAPHASLVISENLHLVKATCAKSFAPFPTGCMFHSQHGLMSFEHPTKKMKPMPRIDSQGVICGAIFNVDSQSNIHLMPRVGSEANWANWIGDDKLA